MERRELLAGGLLLGTSLVTEALAAPPPRPDHDFGEEDHHRGSTSLSFFEGTLKGSGFQGWPFSFSVSGKRALGFAYDPASVGGVLQALRFEGRVRGSELLMQAFALADVNHLTSIGELTGTGSSTGVQGTLAVPGQGGSGTFEAQIIPLSVPETRRLMGGYLSVAQNAAGTPFYTAALALQSGARWELRNIVAAAGLPALTGGAAHRLTGRYAVAEDGRFLLHMTRVPLRFRQPQAATATRASSAPPKPLAAAPRPTAHPHALAPHPAARRNGRAAGAPVVFSDGTFSPTDWTSTKISDTTPAGESSFFAEQVAASGNPGAFRRLTMNWFGTSEVLGAVIIANLGNGMSYDPRTNGAVGSLSFTFDMINLNNTSQQGQGRYFPLVRQGGNYFITSDRAEPPPGAWRSFTFPNLTAQQFHRQGGTGGPDIPDFSATALPLQFGYLAIGAGTRDPVTSVTGIDNYSVTVTPAGVFRSIVLTGSDRPGAGLETDYVALVKDVAGGPAAGEQVIFRLQVEGSPPVSVNVLTGNDGKAHFRHTFSADQNNKDFTLIACLDADRDGVCDPTEAVDQIDGLVEGSRVALTSTVSSVTVNTQICLSASTTAGGLGVGGQLVFLVEQQSTAPLAQGTTSDGGSVQLCFTPNAVGTWNLTAYWDQNGNGEFDTGDLSSNSIHLEVVQEGPPPPPPGTVECSQCCLGQLIIGLQTTHGVRVARPAVIGDQIIIEHPFTHLIGIATRVR